MITIPLVAFPVAHHLGFLTNIILDPITEIKNNEHHVERLIIKNDGILQAKNVDIFINKNDMDLLDSFCLEGTINDHVENPNYLKIHFPKISVDFDCRLTFVGNNNTGIGYALISEEGRDGDEWHVNKEFNESRIFLLNLLFTFIGIAYTVIPAYIIWIWKITPKNRKKLEPTCTLGKYLIEKYGRFLKNHDEKLIIAINDGKNTIELLHNSTNFHKSYIKNRVNFLHKKTILASKDPISLDSNIAKNIKQD